jgi:hypothetical protein
MLSLISLKILPKCWSQRVSLYFLIYLTLILKLSLSFNTLISKVTSSTGGVLLIFFRKTHEQWAKRRNSRAAVFISEKKLRLEKPSVRRRNSVCPREYDGRRFLSGGLLLHPHFNNSTSAALIICAFDGSCPENNLKRDARIPTLLCFVSCLIRGRVATPFGSEKSNTRSLLTSGST